MSSTFDGSSGDKILPLDTPRVSSQMSRSKVPT